MAQPLLDLQDAMDDGMQPLRGISELLHEAAVPGKSGFDILGPQGLAALVDIVCERFARASAMLDLYVKTSRR